MDGKHFVTCAALAASLAWGSACATRTASSARREPLAVPPAPPRVLVPPAPGPTTEPVVSDPEPVPQLPTASRRSRESRTEPKPAQPETPPAPAEAEAPKPAASTGAPPPELRTVEGPDEGKATRQVRDTIERAGRTLGGIDYRALSQQAKLQYDMAKRFIEQSEEALKTRNYTAAQLMADKAETIARELSGR